MRRITKRIAFFSILFAMCSLGKAQENKPSEKKTDTLEPVLNTFAGNYILDNQTVMVPAKGALDLAIQHRFGTADNGYSDMFGLFAPANIRLSAAYTPINKLQVGLGICKQNMTWDGTIKYAIHVQKVHGCPISISYFGDMALDTRPKDGNFVTNNDRLTYFNQLIFASKISEKLSIQLAPSITYFNNVPGYYNSAGQLKSELWHAHSAIAASACYLLTDVMGVMVNVDQPLTTHPENNPHPNISFGLQFATTTHTFQIFAGNYQSIIPQYNNLLNQNDYTKGKFLIGFNITKRFYL